MEAMQTFEHGNFKVETFYIGNTNVAYKVYINGVLVYEDDTFKPSILHAIDGTESLVSLLGFLLLQEGDVNPDYFKKRGCVALDRWANSDVNANLIRAKISDWEQRHDKAWRKENGLSKKVCKRIQKLIVNH